MSICSQLHPVFNQLPHHHFPFDEKKIPLNGIYILFEKGEIAHNTNRIVRVGTHNGDGRLPSRLKSHFIKENKDRSIFRKNIGRALLNKESDPFLEQWELDLTSREAKENHKNIVDFGKQKQIERQVTQCIQQNFWFVVFPIDKRKDRLFWESRIISTVSRCNECRPSENWLGLHSPKDKIRESGLWLVNELYKQPLSENEFNYLKDFMIQSK
jgi:hypothetical protein